MTSNAVATRVATPTLPAPTRVGQATAVEQSRAVAEVQAAIVVAQQCPRSIQAAMAAMEESCGQKFLAEKAFYRFRRGGQNVSGETVHLARELARCFGNIQYGLHELRRDDEAGQSEMQAWAWDVQMNTRSSTTFIVPHIRDGGKEDGGRLTATRDIYENNANNGARRLREMIVAILPPWFVETAKELCMKTLEGDGTKPLAQRISGAIKLFGAIGVTQGELEQKLSRTLGDWTPHDLAQLEVVYRSLQRGETSREEEFPVEQGTDRVTSADIVRPPAVTGKPAAKSGDETGGADPATDPVVTS